MRKMIVLFGFLVFAYAQVAIEGEYVSSNIQNNIKADKLSVSTDVKNNQCNIAIDENIIYQRKCEFEYEPRLVFYALLGNWNEVWIFQDTPMGNACDGGNLRIFEQEYGENGIHYRGEIDFCGGPNPAFMLKRDEIIITNESNGKSYSLQQGKLIISQQTHKIQSNLYKKWKQQWGDYQWGEEPQVNQYYIVETNGAFKDMLRSCDMVGLEQMLHTLRKDEIMSFQRAEGSYLDIVLQEDINPLVVRFLLDNEIIVFKDLNPIDYKQLATQKLQESKAKEDSKAVENYEKIIEVLKQYQNEQ